MRSPFSMSTARCPRKALDALKATGLFQQVRALGFDVG